MYERQAIGFYTEDVKERQGANGRARQPRRCVVVAVSLVAVRSRAAGTRPLSLSRLGCRRTSSLLLGGNTQLAEKRVR